MCPTTGGTENDVIGSLTCHHDGAIILALIQERCGMYDDKDDRPAIQEFFSRLKAELSALEELLAKCGHCGYEDPVYRFYHQSFKVYWLQDVTTEVVAKLQSLAPDHPLNEWFMQIVREGTGRTFANQDNQNWFAVTRPMLEAFFHARYFLEMATKYGKELDYPPQMLPSGWAAVLYLYNLR